MQRGGTQRAWVIALGTRRTGKVISHQGKILSFEFVRRRSCTGRGDFASHRIECGCGSIPHSCDRVVFGTAIGPTRLVQRSLSPAARTIAIGAQDYTARGWRWLVAELARVRGIAEQARILANSATPDTLDGKVSLWGKKW